MTARTAAAVCRRSSVRTIGKSAGVPRRRAALAVALLVLAAGCGGGDEAADKAAPPPELTVPRTEPDRATTTAPSTGTAPTAPSQDPATAPAPSGEGDGSSPGAPQGGADSPQNDTPPPAGSPAERFERECETRPLACG
jgi:hypothetical protein